MSVLDFNHSYIPVKEMLKCFSAKTQSSNVITKLNLPVHTDTNVVDINVKYLTHSHLENTRFTYADPKKIITLNLKPFKFN